MKVGLFLVSVLSKNKLVGGKRVFSSDFLKNPKPTQSCTPPQASNGKAKQ